jgi:hypothetical protein
MQLKEIWYYIFNTPYFEVNINKDMRIIKTFVQPIISNTNTGTIAVTWKNKYSWFILAGTCFQKKNKFIAHVDMENCIPLLEEKRIESFSNDFYITEKTIVSLKESGVEIIDFNTDKSGKQKLFKSAAIPPVAFHQALSAHFLKEALRNPPSKWESLSTAIIIGVIGLVVIAFLYFTSGVKPF